MSIIKLTYFGVPGRAYAIRTALRIGKVPFDDEIIDQNELKANKPFSAKLPLGSVPVLTVSILLKYNTTNFNDTLFIPCIRESHYSERCHSAICWEAFRALPF